MRITKENINQFISGSTMNCSNKGITGIDYIPDYIRHLSCYNNQLTELPKLPNSLKHLDCGDNKLTSLPELPESLIYLYCRYNNLLYEITLDNYKEKHNKFLKRKEILKRICT